MNSDQEITQKFHLKLNPVRNSATFYRRRADWFAEGCRELWDSVVVDDILSFPLRNRKTTIYCDRNSRKIRTILDPLCFSILYTKNLIF